MKNMRTGAILVGAIFGGIFLFLFIIENYANPCALLASMRVLDALLLMTGPFTLIFATLVGLKFERFAGYWLIAGGFITAALLAVRLSDRPVELLLMGLILVVPMLIEGSLWLKHVASITPH